MASREGEADVILSDFEWNQRLERQARERAVKAAALTPQHAAAEAAMDCDGDEGQAEEVRERIRHQAEPEPVDAPEVVHADLDKMFRDAANAPSGYPPFGHVNAEAFRRGPITADHAAYSPAYDPPARPVPVPQGAMNAAAITRPLMTDGQSRASAEG